MPLFDLLRFENPEVLAFALGFLVFILVFYVLTRATGDKGTSLVVAFAISGIATFYLYKEEFILERRIIAFLLIIVVVVIFLKILWAFIRGTQGRHWR